MRLFTQAPYNGRVCTETTTLSNGMTIEKGIQVIWCMDNFHYDSNYYTNPEAFDPARWEGREQNTSSDHMWQPFGEGPRACPGTRLAMLMMKSMVAQLVHQYEVVECERSAKKIGQTFENMLHFVKTYPLEQLI